MAAVTDLLRQENFYYEIQKHGPAHSNRFNISGSKPVTVIDSYYDIALYNNLVTRRSANLADSHHYHDDPAAKPLDEKLSVGYARCEPHGDSMLFGNLQIDQNEPERWSDPTKAKILLARKNIYQALLGESIHYALNKKL